MQIHATLSKFEAIVKPLCLLQSSTLPEIRLRCMLENVKQTFMVYEYVCMVL